MKTLLRFTAVLTLALAGSIAWSSHAVAQMDENEAYANAVVCVDPECEDLTNIAGMEGAAITSFDAAGEVIDTCNVETFASGMDGCTITQHAGDGWYEVAATDEFANYNLLSELPEVLESESHGTQLVWYFAPPADDTVPPDDPPVEDPGDASPPADGTDPISDLPETGAGIVEQSGLLVVATAGLAMMALGATGIRRVVRS